MGYKTILVHLDEARNVSQRIELAARLALAEDAHLTGAAVTGLHRYLYETVAFFPDDAGLAPYLDVLRQRADLVLQKFEHQVRDFGLPSFDPVLVTEEPPGDFSGLARCSDLVLVGQPDPNDPSLSETLDFPATVVMHCARPVLVVPYAGEFDRLLDKVLIAWNASAEAAHAVTQALPLLKRAKQVEVAIFSRASQPGRIGAQAGDDLRRYLARHEIAAQLTQATAGGDVGAELLSLSADHDATLMVAGCYGHSRFREILLGGVTRTLLKSMTVPVLMAH
jgi:nucleotide-binding universal stress UspA family protein